MLHKFKSIVTRIIAVLPVLCLGFGSVVDATPKVDVHKKYCLYGAFDGSMSFERNFGIYSMAFTFEGEYGYRDLYEILRHHDDCSDIDCVKAFECKSIPVIERLSRCFWGEPRFSIKFDNCLKINNKLSVKFYIKNPMKIPYCAYDKDLVSDEYTTSTPRDALINAVEFGASCEYKFTDKFKIDGSYRMSILNYFKHGFINVKFIYEPNKYFSISFGNEFKYEGKKIQDRLYLNFAGKLSFEKKVDIGRGWNIKLASNCKLEHKNNLEIAPSDSYDDE